MRNGSPSSSGNKRTFVAVDISPSKKLVDAVSQWRQEMQRDRIRWVSLQQVHLTLTFLGDTPLQKVKEIEKSLLLRLAGIPCFVLSLKGMGIFGRLTDPRVFWVGVEENEILGKIKTITDQVAGEAGFAVDTRPFSPHITIARPVHVTSREALSRLMDEYRDTLFMEEKICEVIYYESILTREGSIYTVLEKFSLE
jgi:RNA 2',3'-cyclic 3'-phosphodiesterase